LVIRRLEILFTPWRYSYLTSPKGEQSCIFCVAARTEDYRSTLTLFRSGRVLVMLNRYPYTNGHVMVAPVAHQANLFQTDADILSLLMRIAAESQRILTECYRPDGFNIGMNFGTVAGAGFADHYHMHIVPRWGGDSNFMTVTAQTRLVPEDIEVTLERLRPLFQTLNEAFGGG
jgi:ATP adenylyltransferase